ncbi:MAG: acyltransferase [Alphaproteobacteria bacterium]|nr:acyltransferase [Alphaproteobacteria bacterium]
MDTKQARNSNFELLRILSIIMIIGYHYVVHGNFSDVERVQDRIMLNILSSCGKMGVNIFCLTMGYFGIESQNVSTRKIIRIEGQVLFYSLLGLALGTVVDRQLLSTRTILCSLFPTITEHYWFFSAYVIVFLLSCYLNRFLKSIRKGDFVKLLLLCYTLWGIIPFFTLRENHGLFWNQLIWFFVMYMTGAYLKLFSPKKYQMAYHFWGFTSIFLLMMSSVICELLALKIPAFEGYSTYFRWSNSPFVIVASFSLFCIAICSPEHTSKLINWIAGFVFGIYLFHENIFIRDILWMRILDTVRFNTVGNLIIHFVLSLVIVFVVGCLFEYLRKLLECFYVDYLDLMANKVDNKIISLINKLTKEQQ